MFNLFGKKDRSIPVADRVLMNEEGKLNALFREWSADNKTVFVFWFEESLDKAAKYFASRTNIPGNLIMAREASHLKDKKTFFAEHHPLADKEQELFKKLSLPVAYIYSSLDEPLFKLFGGDRIITLMKQLGMKEDEVIEHKMISNSIRQAQQKIGKKVMIDQSATSQEAWIKKMTIS